MHRRKVLSAGGAALGAALAGCLGDDDDGSDDGSTPTPTPSPTPTPESEVGYNPSLDKVQLADCESQYIESNVVADDATVEQPPEPQVTRQIARDDGEYVELQAQYTTSGSGDEETESRQVVSWYLVTDDGDYYRTDDPDADPRDGTEVDC